MAKKPKTEATSTPPPIGSMHTGTAFYVSGISPGAFVNSWPSTPKTPEESAMIKAIRQLETWRERGYELQVRSTDSGWVSALNEDDDNTVTLRFNSGYHPTFVAAVQKAMEVIK